MEFTPWSLLGDAGLIGGLLVIGAVARAKLRVVQLLMLPSSVVAGFLGLLLGPNGFDLLPFSDQLGTYSSILIIAVFACLALTNDARFGDIGRSTRNLACYSMSVYTLQVGIGAAFGLLVLAPIWGTPDGFGVLLFAGWAGGFGSAAAVGQTFEATGWEAATSLAFTSATVGMLIGVVGGIILNAWGSRRGHCTVGRFSELPDELRTGLIRAPDKREPTGRATTSASSIEPLALQLCLVLVVGAAAYAVSEGIAAIWPGFLTPQFALAFVIGLLVRLSFRRTPAWRYVDSQTLRGISGSATDVLIVCGIASIQPSVVADYWLPLLVLFVVGLALCLVMFLFVAPATFRGRAWFEKALFSWGWATGSVATGVALLRMADPDLKSRTLEEFGIAYLPVAPVETASVTFAPLIVAAGAAWALAGGWAAAGIVALALPFLLDRRRRRATHESTEKAGSSK